jgi:hypothetical protein
MAHPQQDSGACWPAVSLKRRNTRSEASQSALNVIEANAPVRFRRAAGMCACTKRLVDPCPDRSASPFMVNLVQQQELLLPLVGLIGVPVGDRQLGRR